MSCPFVRWLVLSLHCIAAGLTCNHVPPHANTTSPITPYPSRQIRPIGEHWTLFHRQHSSLVHRKPILTIACVKAIDPTEKNSKAKLARNCADWLLMPAPSTVFNSMRIYLYTSVLFIDLFCSPYFMCGELLLPLPLHPKPLQLTSFSSFFFSSFFLFPFVQPSAKGAVTGALGFSMGCEHSQSPLAHIPHILLVRAPGCAYLAGQGPAYTSMSAHAMSAHVNPARPKLGTGGELKLATACLAAWWCPRRDVDPSTRYLTCAPPPSKCCVGEKRLSTDNCSSRGLFSCSTHFLCFSGFPGTDQRYLLPLP